MSAGTSIHMAARWRYGPFDPKEVFKGDFRGVLGPLFVTTSNAKAVADTEAFIAYLDARSDVAGDKIGAVGFCMGGGMAIAAAGTWPDRFAAVVSFHDGNLATEAADSPHGYAPKSKADPYIAAAENDATYRPRWRRKSCTRLRMRKFLIARRPTLRRMVVGPGTVHGSLRLPCQFPSR